MGLPATAVGGQSTIPVAILSACGGCHSFRGGGFDMVHVICDQKK